MISPKFFIETLDKLGLPEVYKQLQQLQKEVDALKGQLKGQE